MAKPSMTRKRVHAVRRAADGSAFEKCDQCGLLVAVALADMHECKSKRTMKRFKRFHGIKESFYAAKDSLADQPRSAFCFFMESFTKSREGEDLLDIARDGFETWKSMTTEERKPYVVHELKISAAYRKALHQEIKDASDMEDEADSAEAWKFDRSVKGTDNDDSRSFELFSDFDSFKWEMMLPWAKR